MEDALDIAARRSGQAARELGAAALELAREALDVQQRRAQIVRNGIDEALHLFVLARQRHVGVGELRGALADAQLEPLVRQPQLGSHRRHHQAGHRGRRHEQLEQDEPLVERAAAERPAIVDAGQGGDGRDDQHRRRRGARIEAQPGPDQEREYRVLQMVARRRAQERPP